MKTEKNAVYVVGEQGRGGKFFRVHSAEVSSGE